MSNIVEICQCQVDKIRHCRISIQSLDKIRQFLDNVELENDKFGFSTDHCVMRRRPLSKRGMSSLTNHNRVSTHIVCLPPPDWVEEIRLFKKCRIRHFQQFRQEFTMHYHNYQNANQWKNYISIHVYSISLKPCNITLIAPSVVVYGASQHCHFAIRHCREIVEFCRLSTWQNMT